MDNISVSTLGFILMLKIITPSEKILFLRLQSKLKKSHQVFLSECIDIFYLVFKSPLYQVRISRLRSSVI